MADLERPTLRYSLLTIESCQCTPSDYTMGSSTSNVDLLIIGAGPAGLTAACWAAQYKMSTRIIDQKEGRTETGHADGIQSRSLEILESFGIVDSILKQGIPNVDMSHWVSTRTVSEVIVRR